MRALQLRRASKMLWDEKEECRAFHSKVLLCEVLEERDAQIRIREQAAVEDAKAEAECLAVLRVQWQVGNRSWKYPIDIGIVLVLG